MAGNVIQLIQVLRPKPCPRALVRVGGAKDGAYLLPMDFDGISACFSPGVSNRKDFEDELLEAYGISSHMCDFSSDPDKFKTPLKPEQTFKKKWLDINGADDSISLQAWVEELAPNPGDDLILQMDIEGAEYRNILNTPEHILRRFRIIVIELHGLKMVNRLSEFSKKLGPLLELLDRHFQCVHAHPNNCCGEFKLQDSELNIPNVHELTFLRRDRWDGVSLETCHEPMLPHPMDISPNVSGNLPIFLNEHWLDPKKRHPESEIKLLKDRVGYLEGALSIACAAEASAGHEAVVRIHKLAQYSASLLPDLAGQPTRTDWVELSAGKSFVLSSRHAACPRVGNVEPKRPFFFHTAEGYDQAITLDLGMSMALWELRIFNRTDGYQQRARCLFYCVHKTPEPDFSKGLPVAIEKGFLTTSNEPSMTNLRGGRARYLTVFSPERTMLHFSNLQVLGCP